jgi:hypothetical protein
MFYEATRRLKADGSPQPWVSDHDGRSHPYVYDIDCNEDGHRLGTVTIVSWIWVRAANADEVWALPNHQCRFSVWSQAKGRWIDGEAEAHAVGGDDLGFGVPTSGIHSVVSIDDIPLSVRCERNVIPV